MNDISQKSIHSKKTGYGKTNIKKGRSRKG